MDGDASAEGQHSPKSTSYDDEYYNSGCTTRAGKSVDISSNTERLETDEIFDNFTKQIEPSYSVRIVFYYKYGKFDLRYMIIVFVNFFNALDLVLQRCDIRQCLFFSISLFFHGRIERASKNPSTA